MSYQSSVRDRMHKNIGTVNRITDVVHPRWLKSIYSFYLLKEDSDVSGWLRVGWERDMGENGTSLSGG